MDEFVKKEEKTYIIHADSLENDFQEICESKQPILNTATTIDEDFESSHEPQKNIEVVNGDGKDLDISDVSEYLEVEKPKEEKKGTIIIPEEKK